MKRNPIPHVVFDLRGGEVILKSRPNDARRNAIHADIEIGQFSRQRPRERRYGSLSHAVGNRSGATTASGRRRNQQDRAPAALDHVRNSSPGEMIDRVNVDVEGLVPNAGIHFEQATLRWAARTMDQYIQPPKRSGRVLHATYCFGGVRFIGSDWLSS